MVSNSLCDTPAMPPGLTPTEYRLLVQHSPVMIWRAGIDARCDYFNETWLAFTGRTLDRRGASPAFH